MFGKGTLLFLFITLFAGQLISQETQKSDKELIKIINEADGYLIYDENYLRASHIYEEILKEHPDNQNTAYKLGICYLNLKGMQSASLDLLKFASSSYVEDIEYSTIGPAAPFDVLYYLAYSAQINKLPAEAIEYYKKYQNLLRVKEVSEIEFIDLQIRACQNALTIPPGTPDLIRESFPDWISGYKDAVYPVLSGNDSLFLFTILKLDGNLIMSSERVNGMWSEPVDITLSLGKYGDMFTNSLTYDGTKLLIARNDGIKGDLYQSTYKNGAWSKVQKLNKNINTPYWESFGFISGDGSTLYFTSNKPGGYGSLDIYTATLDKNGDFGPARNLGPIINSKLEEETPYYDSESKELWFSSTGHEGYGGYDIFLSTFDRRWSKPVHLDYPINNAIDNLNYIPYKKKEAALLTLLPTDTTRWSSIYLVKKSTKKERGIITVRGQVKLGDGLDIESSKLKISLYKAESDTLIANLGADSNGNFEYPLFLDSYSFLLSYPGYSSDTLSLVISEDFTGDEIRIDHTLIPVSITRGEYLKISTILFEFDQSSLSREAQLEIEKLIPVIVEYPYLRIELRGYTDAIGSREYNMELSRKRALGVASYLIDSGIEESRIQTIPMGAAGYVTNNLGKDGKDNPEGRRYNRRVSINIINDGYYVPVETYAHIPRHLKNSDQYSYYVVLHESEAPVDPAFFKRAKLGELSFLKEIKFDQSYIYVMGPFLSRTDALNYLVNAREDGFSGRIITEFDLPDNGSESRPETNQIIYTIQIHALSKPAEEPFRDLKNIRVIKGSDGWYRYVTGEYYGYSRAVNALKKIREMGYPQAFIKELSVLESQTLNR